MQLTLSRSKKNKATTEPAAAPSEPEPAMAAAVAPAELPAVKIQPVEVSTEEAHAPIDESAEQICSDGEGPDDEEEHDDEEEEEHDPDEVKQWDEGGKSHCGYGDGVHETLMAIGEKIHKIVGEPSENVKEHMRSIGNWFQEASYAARDFERGKMNVGEEMAEGMKSVVTGDEQDEHNEEEGDEHADGAEATSDAEGGDEKLEPVMEDDVSEGKASAN